jgi:hypothetical protein
MSTRQVIVKGRKPETGFADQRSGPWPAISWEYWTKFDPLCSLRELLGVLDGNAQAQELNVSRVTRSDRLFRLDQKLLCRDRDLDTFDRFDLDSAPCVRANSRLRTRSSGDRPRSRPRFSRPDTSQLRRRRSAQPRCRAEWPWPASVAECSLSMHRLRGRCLWWRERSSEG